LNEITLLESSSAGAALDLWNDLEPIRGELLAGQRLEALARELADEHKISRRRGRGNALARRARHNSRRLLHDYQLIGAAASPPAMPLTPAAEWLRDNYILVERQLQQIRDDLPRGFYYQLPKLGNGPLNGYPRVLSLAWNYVAHTDSLFDPAVLCRFITAYQRQSALNVGELWALATVLRIVLIENLRRCADRVISGHRLRNRADELADRLLGTPAHAAALGDHLVADYANQELPPTFSVRLLQRLRDHDPVTIPALQWLEEKLARQGRSIESVVNDEHQRQAAANVTVRNIITSLRRLTTISWTDLVEGMSVVDERLRAGSNFSKMDFATRTRYRDAIEELARNCGCSETKVVDRVIDVTRKTHAFLAGSGPSTHTPIDVGHYLIGPGRREFTRLLTRRSLMRFSLPALIRAGALNGYLTCIFALTGFAISMIFVALRPWVSSQWIWGYLLVALLPCVEVITQIVNLLYTHALPPRALPAYDLKGIVPFEMRTLVVMPVMLTTLSEIETHIARLEAHYLASARGELYFALLSDFVDAASEHTSADESLIVAAAAGIDELNRRYEGDGAGPRFFILHRRRKWSDDQGCWIGWERKRGKLHELNRLLLGAADTSFDSTMMHWRAPPKAVRYVITLDADTELPRTAAERLIGKMAHPLNIARFDSQGRVISGYAILQPRVSPALLVDQQVSLFHKAFTSGGGLDPYVFAVSDLYQDLCDEGSFIGKGIYDVAAFEDALEGRVPENAVLSHDLFEGIFARAGFVSDVELLEPFPDRYDVAAARQHRWTRGDWQLLPYLWKTKASQNAASREQRIPALGRWKMLDNLRRSLNSPAFVIALLAGAALPEWSGVVWVSAVLVAPCVPRVLGLIDRLGGMMRSHRHVSVGDGIRGDFSGTVLQGLLSIALLADQAWLMVDAIFRTLYRLTISRRHFLDWTTAAQVTRNGRADFGAYLRRMAPAIFIGVVSGAWWRINSGAVFPLALVPIVWICSPVIAWWVSKPRPIAIAASLIPADASTLRLVARRTWLFFEHWVTPADHHLPPDNYQETPVPVLARRTSPTNIGLYLLSAATARAFGWIGLLDFLDRVEATLGTIERLEKRRGHLYNWYNTESLQPLEPQYISTVDSGNLAGHLIALAQVCEDLAVAPLLGVERLRGVADAYELALESELSAREAPAVGAVTPAAWSDSIASILSSDVRSPIAQIHAIRELADVADQLDSARERSGKIEDSAWPRAPAWDMVVGQTARSHARDLNALLDSEGTFASRISGELLERLKLIATRARALAIAMDFTFLFDAERQLLSIGYSASDNHLDANCYDLLASEARLGSFIAVAKGDLETRHWFRLGRAMTRVGRSAALLSWSGSMFEYLMPSLVMHAPVDSLLERTNRTVVLHQQSYAEANNLPWGVSESAYNVRDVEFTYQYSDFGVPGLGLKLGRERDAVVAPYATALGALVDPVAAARNIAKLRSLGALGYFGYYEALDFTASRVPPGQSVAIVRTYMAHHQGMTITAIGNVLLQGFLRSCFHNEPMVRAAESLLQERAPQFIETPVGQGHGFPRAIAEPMAMPPLARRFTSCHTQIPVTQILGNGRYAVMLTTAGSGYSRWGALAVTRWREDRVRDDWGAYIYLRDVDSKRLWSAGYQPTQAVPDHYAVSFAEDRCEIQRRDGPVITTTEILVSVEHDAEVRRVALTNRGGRARTIDVTSYSEVVLATPSADQAHPAFAKLFVQTEYVEAAGALLAVRHRRAGEPEAWAAHVALVEGEEIGPPQYETDRARFLGRGREVEAAEAVLNSQPLSGTVGVVLDPVFSLRRRLRIASGQTAYVSFWTVVGHSRQEVLDVVSKLRADGAFSRAAMLAWTYAQVQLRHLRVDPEEANLFQQLAAYALYTSDVLSPARSVLRNNINNATALWAHGISGDRPIVCVHIHSAEDLGVVRQMLRAHEYWAWKNLAADLVIVNDVSFSYAQELQGTLEVLARATLPRSRDSQRVGAGQIYVLRWSLMSQAARQALQAASRIELMSRRGSIAEQLGRLKDIVTNAPVTAQKSDSSVPLPALPVARNLEYFNGLGGFTADGREYVTILEPGKATPMPWVNVIANPSFGFQVSTEGSGCTWCLNSRENSLTPWSNDPVSNRPGEALYVRDEDTGELWSVTAAPIRDSNTRYVATHGQGYSRFEATTQDIAMELLQFVPLADSVKISRLRLRNLGSRSRRLSVCAYVEWALGPSRSVAAQFVITERCPSTGALLARNPWNVDFGRRVAFLDFGGHASSGTCDRAEFLGRYGSVSSPAALRLPTALSECYGAGLDPAAALLSRVSIPSGVSIELVVLLGQAADNAQAREMIKHYRQVEPEECLRQVTQHWDTVLGRIQVKTPDSSMDHLLNRWLLYQCRACRIWARTAFYQSSGAYGFRDQLQDGMALAVADPATTRQHLLRAASRQFREGDVQHWWMPESGRGVRTHIVDDRIWLGYAVCQYVTATHDVGILDEQVPFLEGPAVPAESHDSYFLPSVADESATLYEHCALGLDGSLGLGAHGLPLIGTGDWNDGFSSVGAEGRGESVWLGWFLAATLNGFTGLAAARGDTERVARWSAHYGALREGLEGAGWDGDWYRRGYFDDGTPLGSKENRECRIDAIAQSWSVISGAANMARAAHAMAAATERLVRTTDGVALLFEPPFVVGAPDPGYIRAYPPGIRENGGQYTHGALWSIIASAMLGDGDTAMALFSLINPINRSASPQAVARYQVEPYVVAADVYFAPGHVGRGGWTWYTGAAGWMYRAGIEWVLGIRVLGDSVSIDPCIPRGWRGFEITLRHGSATYEIAVTNPFGLNRGISHAELDDGTLLRAPLSIPLRDDGAVHGVRVVMGRSE